MLYRGEEGQGKESKVTIGKLYELMKNMGNAINEHLNTMSETTDAKKIDNALQKVDKICEQIVNITTRVNSREQEMRTIITRRVGNSMKIYKEWSTCSIV